MFNQSIKTFWSLIYLFVSKELPLEMMNCSVPWLISFRSWKKSLFHDVHSIENIIIFHRLFYAREKFKINDKKIYLPKEEAS